MASKGNKAENVKKTAPWFAPSQIKKFSGEVKAEYLKIVWPNWKTTLGLTGIVVVLSLVISIYLGSVDLLLGRIISSILR
jgi:preprotein translocase subunit SecE